MKNLMQRGNLPSRLVAPALPAAVPWDTLLGSPTPEEEDPLSTNYSIFIATHANTKTQYLFSVFFQIKSGDEYWGGGEQVRIQVSQG